MAERHLAEGVRKLAVGKDPPNPLNPPNLKGPARSWLEFLGAEQRFPWRVQNDARPGQKHGAWHGQKQGAWHRVMPGPGDVSPRAQPGLRSHTPQGAPASAPASRPPRIRPPTAGREPMGDLHLAEQRLFGSDPPLFTTWESPSRARAVGQMGRMRHGTAPSHPVLSYFSLLFFFFFNVFSPQRSALLSELEVTIVFPDISGIVCDESPV